MSTAQQPAQVNADDQRRFEDELAELTASQLSALIHMTEKLSDSQMRMIAEQVQERMRAEERFRGIVRKQIAPAIESLDNWLDHLRPQLHGQEF